ncbi:DUF3741-associated sequence motif [Sesbania bispinosa]|nr:DUF3741-associated sequence motif [Sesbania bispinosa]
MAKRSDFAQKLLDDLRLRKERMASSQRSNQSHSHHLPIDAFAYTKQTYRGSRNTKVTEIVSSRTGGEMLNRRHRSVNNGDLSNQIIPYQSSGNVSQALAFAFENGGKLRRADFSYPNSIMGFLHQIKRGTNLDRQLASTSHYPTLSLVQINEISKGAQKLNHILRACSNGLNMDTSSLQFAKELLQGAIDLEESLRMLVDLQKNSEFVITSQAQNKNRIRLLDEEEEDDDDRKMEISEQMQLARPNFSFDKPPRHIQEVGKAISIQRPMTKEARNSNNEKKSVKKQVSQKRSTSSSSDISERQNQTTSNQEKGRIPNVIAKLMGLDNLPEKVEIGGNQGMASKHTAKGSTKKNELKNKQTVNLIPMATKNQKMVGVGALKMPESQNEELMFGALLQKASYEVVVQNQNGKPLWRDPDGIKALTSFDKASTKMDRHNTNSAQKNLIRESQNDVQVIGRKQDHPNYSSREQKGTVKVRTNDPLVNNMLAQLEQVHERSELKSSIQVEKEIKGSIIQPEKKHTNKHILNKEKNPRNHFGVQKPYILSKNGPQEEKHHREQQLQLREEQMLMMRPQGGCDMTSKKSSKHPHQLINPQKKLNQATVLKKNLGENVASMKLESSHYDDHDLVKDDTSNDTNEKVGEIMNSKSGQISSPRDQGVERAKGRHGVKTLKDEKHVHKLARKKIMNSRKQRVDMPGRNGAKLISDKGKQQIPSLQEARDRAPDKVKVLHGAEQERVNMFREADTCIISSNEPIAATVELDVKSQPRKEAELPPTLHSSSGGGELQSQQEYHYQDVQSVAINLQDQSVPVAVNEGFKTGEIALRKTNEILEDRVDINHSQLQPLTESENYLKWILVMSQLFVNTAEALFKLNIPFSVLQGGGQDIQDEGSKLVLDCGYEVMKRKGIRQELKVHTCSKISISTVNIRSLDDLVRQLNEDMEKLKFYGRKNSQVDVEDYLPKMLEHDVYDKDPDIDCMWDLGWNDETFAFIEKYDVIRDTEKHILSVLLDEITGDCCMLK